MGHGSAPHGRRDVKSSNVLLTEEGRAKVADMGLASMSAYFSSNGGTAGTFSYAAPELLLAERCTDKVGVQCFKTVISFFVESSSLVSSRQLLILA